MRARARASRISPRLAQVTRALRPVRLDAGADRADAGDPHHVVGAQLEPVKRVLHGLAGARQAHGGGRTARRADEP